MTKRDQRVPAAAERRRAKAGRGPSDEASTFMRALTFGALVGAAIAGSTILTKVRNRDEEPPRG